MNCFEIVISEDKLDPLLSYLRSDFGGYHYDDEKDPSYFSRLLSDFGELDLLDELKQYHAWTLDQPQGKKILYRRRFRSWLKLALQFKQDPWSRPYWLVREKNA